MITIQQLRIEGWNIKFIARKEVVRVATPVLYLKEKLTNEIPKGEIRMIVT